jgi:hypothetical protein
MNSSITLYGLDVLTFFRYSLFFFYIIEKKNLTLNRLKKQNIKVSYLYNNSFNKKNKVFLIYSNKQYNIFDINSLIYILNKINIKKRTSLSYNNNYYNYYYYNNSNIKNYLFYWITFFSFKKKSIFNSLSILYFNKMNISFFYLFFKNIKTLWLRRNITNKQVLYI